MTMKVAQLKEELEKGYPDGKASVELFLGDAKEMSSFLPEAGTVDAVLMVNVVRLAPSTTGGWRGAPRREAV